MSQWCDEVQPCLQPLPSEPLSFANFRVLVPYHQWWAYGDFNAEMPKTCSYKSAFLPNQISFFEKMLLEKVSWNWIWQHNITVSFHFFENFHFWQNMTCPSDHSQPDPLPGLCVMFWTSTHEECDRSICVIMGAPYFTDVAHLKMFIAYGCSLMKIFY